MKRTATAALAAIVLAACGSAPVQTPVTVGEVHVRTRSAPTVALSKEESKLYAEAVLPFARVASRAYCDYLQQVDAQPQECNGSRPMVEQDGWELLFDSREVLKAEDRASKLTFLSFMKVRQDDPTVGDIVFGFRGTKFSYASDWQANFRWVTRFFGGRDQYEILYSYVPGLIEKANRMAALKAPQVRHFNVYSTGHSLGGGLAQLFAYSSTKVSAAIVFDPSPVTGYFNVVKDGDVNCHAKVLRVYERGEVLQYLRAMMRRLYTPTENVAEVDFNVLHTGFDPLSPLTNHSIKTFTDKLDRAVAALKADTGAESLDRVERRNALEDRLPRNPDPACIADRIGKKEP